MVSNFEEAEGIIIKVIPFRDYDQILIIFSKEQGIVKLIYKGSRSKKKGLQGVCTPLTAVQIIYRETRGELCNCQEITALEFHHSLRQSLPCLEAACDCLQALERSQLVGKASPLLYGLLQFYLTRMNEVQNPWVLAVSFRLKLLLHDGYARFPFICSVCQQVLQESAYVNSTDWQCNHHATTGIYWTKEEIQQAYRLALSQSFQDFIQEPLTDSLKSKVLQFFTDSVHT